MECHRQEKAPGDGDSWRGTLEIGAQLRRGWRDGAPRGSIHEDLDKGRPDLLAFAFGRRGAWLDRGGGAAVTSWTEEVGPRLP
uniref:Uncharacterized protein n=1 Tax=Arundo donax TaxID=35708 RepID=A0A0A8XY89_ARUDO